MTAGPNRVRSLTQVATQNELREQYRQVIAEVQEEIHQAAESSPWQLPEDGPRRQRLPGAAVDSQGRFYAIGGSAFEPPISGITSNRFVDCYDPQRGTWSLVTPLRFGRAGLATTTALGQIYALGGKVPTAEGLQFFIPTANEWGVTALAERYDPTRNQWTLIPPMPTRRYDLAAATDAHGNVYAVGGGDDVTQTVAYKFGQSGTVTDTYRGGKWVPVAAVEVFNPRAGTWTTAAPLPTARWGLAAATDLRGRIYAIGGVSGLSVQGQVFCTAVERYDPATGQWSVVAPLPVGRAYAGAARGTDGRLYVFGGQVATGTEMGTRDVLVYDPNTNHWAASHPLQWVRNGVAVAAGPDGRIYVAGTTCGHGDEEAAPFGTESQLGAETWLP